MGVLSTLAAATPLRRSVTMCLDGEVQAEVDAIEASFNAALDEDKRHGTAEDPAPAYNAAILRREAMVERIAASEVTFVVERLDWRERVALQAEHPPRPGHLADNARGYNFETFLPALIRASVVAVTDAAGDTETDIPDTTWDALLGAPAVPAAPATEATDTEPARKARRARKAIPGSLNLSQVNTLVEAAMAVNEQGNSVPRSALSLLVSQDSGESSTSPSPGPAPAPSASTGGNRRTSTKSSGGRKPTAKKATAKKTSSARSAAS